MKVLLFVALFLISLPAFGQTAASPRPSLTLTMTVEEANTVLGKLSEMPWKDINGLMNKFIAQINAQTAPAPAPAPPKE